MKQQCFIPFLESCVCMRGRHSSAQMLDKSIFLYRAYIALNVPMQTHSITLHVQCIAIETAPCYPSQMGDIHSHSKTLQLTYNKVLYLLCRRVCSTWLHLCVDFHVAHYTNNNKLTWWNIGFWRVSVFVCAQGRSFVIFECVCVCVFYNTVYTIQYSQQNPKPYSNVEFRPKVSVSW